VLTDLSPVLLLDVHCQLLLQTTLEAQPKAVAGCGLGNVGELAGRVVVQVDLLGEAAGQPWVGLQEARHLVLVARQDDQHIAAVVLDLGEQRAHHLGGEGVGSVAIPHEGVGLVDEQTPTHGIPDRILHVRARVPHILPLQLQPILLHEVVLRQHPVRMQEARNQPRQGGLACAGVASEHDVEADLQNLLRPSLLHKLHSFAKVAKKRLPSLHAHKSLDLSLHFGSFVGYFL